MCNVSVQTVIDPSIYDFIMNLFNDDNFVYKLTEFFNHHEDQVELVLKGIEKRNSQIIPKEYKFFLTNYMSIPESEFSGLNIYFQLSELRDIIERIIDFASKKNQQTIEFNSMILRTKDSQEEFNLCWGRNG